MERDGRLPVQELPREGRVGAADLRVVDGARFEDELRGAVGQRADEFREVPHGNLFGVSEVDRSGEVGSEDAPDPFDEVVDVAERTGL